MKTRSYNNTSTGLVLLAHGSRDPRWRRPFEVVCGSLQAALDPRPVELAYLQHCEPTLTAALRACAGRGVTQALVVPAFMSSGGHLLRDVPDQVQQAAAEVPGLSVRCAGAIAEEPEVAQAMVAACVRLMES